MSKCRDLEIGVKGHSRSAAKLCQILRIVTIEIVINSTRVMRMHVTISCRYCIAFEVMLLVSSVSMLCISYMYSCVISCYILLYHTALL